MLRRAPIIILLTVAALAGCGPAAGQDSTEGFSGPPAEVVATVEALQEAASSRDAQTVCSNLLADALRAKRTPCAEAVEDALAATDVVELEVPRDGVQIQGDRARVRVEVGADEEAVDTVTFAMVREGRNWKLAGIEGAAAPGGGPQG
ncbi:MAG: hypothetical protein H0X56_02575 [Solirubrobacterales bacterium]|jgi:predicted small lipoprotein YifL|nr:hypothetical protein [Solirubrobacterales bacterium]